MHARSLTWAIILATLTSVSASAETYYADPTKGAATNDGSKTRPWSTLQDVISNGQLKKLKGGDTLLLASGHHGDIKFSGDNDAMITIAAAPDARPTLSRLTITSGKNWTLRGLTISPSFAKESYKGSIVTLADGGPSSHLLLEDCFIFTTEDTAKWDAQTWINTNSGINAGRHGKDLTLRNNYVLNTRFGITLASYDTLCEANIVSDFSADGIRTTRDGQTLRHNIVKNAYVSDADGDKNHDDGIQAFLFNKGTGEVKNVKVLGNIIINREDAKQFWAATMQGIGFFDGPLVNFEVKDNVILVDHWHGLSLYDAQNCTIENNTVLTHPGSKMKAWIILGTKLKLAKDNTVKNNVAPTFNLKQPNTIEENNKPVTPELYNTAIRKLLKTINDKHGEKHRTADRFRLVLPETP